jgi:hypothetical protein
MAILSLIFCHLKNIGFAGLFRLLTRISGRFGRHY